MNISKINDLLSYGVLFIRSFIAKTNKLSDPYGKHLKLLNRYIRDGKNIGIW